MPRGVDISFTVKFDIYHRAKQGESAYKISKALGIRFETAQLWSHPDTLKRIEATGSFESQRRGNVGRKPLYDAKGANSLMDELEKPNMTQVKLAKQEDVDRRTIRRATKYNAQTNPDGCVPYAQRKCSNLTPLIQKQSMAYVRKSPIGKAALGSQQKWDKDKQKFAWVDHSPTAMSGAVNRSHRPNWKRKSTKRRDGLEPENCGDKMAAKHQVFTAVCWKKKLHHVHSKRKRKKKKGVNVKPTYRLEKESVTTAIVVDVINKKFGPALRRAGVKWVFCDNDKKLQSNAVKEAWKKFGITLWPGAGEVTNSGPGGFPVNRPICNPLDQSIHASWKTHEGGLYDTWNGRKASRRTPGGFLNDIDTSWKTLPMKKVRAAIDAQRQICERSRTPKERTQGTTLIKTFFVVKPVTSKNLKLSS